MSLVDDHVGSMQITVDEDGFVGSEQRQPVLDRVGGVREQTRVMTGLSSGSLDLLERRAHDGWVERGPRLAGECVGQPGRQQVGRNRNAVQGAQRRAEAVDHCLARVRVRRRPGVVQGSAGQAFRRPLYHGPSGPSPSAR